MSKEKRWTREQRPGDIPYLGTEDTLRLIQAAVDHSQESVLITDAASDLPSSTILYVNPAFTQMTGYAADEVIGKTPRMLQDSATGGAALDRLRSCMQTGTDFNGESLNYRKDGSQFKTKCHIVPVRDANQQITSWVAVQRQLTERPASEGQATLLSELVGLSNEAMIVHGTGGEILCWNRGAEALYGYSSEEMVGRSVSRLTSVDRQQEWGNLLERVQAGEEIKHFKTCRLRKDGTSVEISVSLAALEFAGDRAVLSCDTEISVFQKTDPALHANDASHQTVLDALAEGVIVIGRNWEILSLNSAARHLLSKIPGPISGNSIRQLLAGSLQADSRPYADGLDPVSIALQSGTAQRNVIMGLSGIDDERRWFSVNLQPQRSTDESDNFSMVVTFRDITDRRKAERLVEEQQGILAHLNRVTTMGEMAAAIAHELSQPLFALNNYVENCIATMPVETPESVQQDLNEIAKLSHRTSRLLTRMRRYITKSAPLRSTVNSQQVLAEAIDLVQHEALQYEINIELSVAEPHVEVQADAVLLRQVAVNVLRNSIEAVRNMSGQRAIIVGCRAEGHNLEIRVEDTGPGLEAENIEHVFDPFYTSKDGGLGMGLAIARSVVQSHAGSISFENRIGGGAICRILIPI